MKWIYMQRREVSFYTYYFGAINYSEGMKKDFGFGYENFILYCPGGLVVDSLIREDNVDDILNKIKNDDGFFKRLEEKFDENFRLSENYNSLIRDADFSKMDDREFLKFFKILCEIFKKSYTSLRIPLVIEGLIDTMPNKQKEIEKFAKLRNKLAEKVYISTHINDEKLLIDIGRRMGIPKRLQTRLLPEEIISFFESGKQPDLKLLEEREKYIIMIDNGKIRIISGDKTEAIINSIEIKRELKGKCGSKGKVKGKVKVIHSASELKDLNEPSIIVCSLTSAEFTPYFNKFLAVVTEDSGILNHAAVTSRELGIPCIVGLNGATEIFKDGDLVEIDADNGIVRKIE
jgi:phosphohistidine swiveling domain-containing protein